MNDYKHAEEDAVNKSTAELAVWTRQKLAKKCGGLKRAFRMFDEVAALRCCSDAVQSLTKNIR